MMWKTLQEFGVSGAVGAVFGLLLAEWIEPTTPEGLGLLVSICVVVIAALVRIVRFSAESRRDAGERDVDEKS